jgi:hypothetical protein
MLDFFTNIYRRFFDLEPIEQNKPTIEGLVDMDLAPSLAPSTAPPKDPDDTKTFVNNSDKIFKDKLNPILTQTIKRTLVVDSQYRDKSSVSSTSFTFNLSEPLKDIVSLKLYSIQIPYSWYTVNNSFGGNFFFIKGASPGLDDGTQDFRMNILSGNYTPDTLITAINQSIQTLATLPEYKDIDFGDTGISYNSPTCLSTIVVDLKKTFNESNFYMYFPEWTPPNDSIARRTTLAGYLGFNSQTYGLSEIYSERDLPLQNTAPTAPDNVNSLYVLDASNNAFHIHVYDGTDATNKYITYDVSLNSATYTRNGLFAAVNTALAALDVLDSSKTSLSRIDIIGDQFEDAGKSFFKLEVKLNRLKTLRDEGYKIAIEFPNEGNNGQTPVWTGSSSCFHFMLLMNECNQVLSETNTLQTNYIIPAGGQIQIKLVCITWPYDTSFNTYNFIVPTSIVTGYLLTDLVANINVAIQTSNLEQSLSDTHNDLGYPSTQFLVDPDNYLDLNIDLTRVFRNRFYHADISHRYYGEIHADLSGNISEHKNTFPIASAYTLSPSDTFFIRPKMVAGGFVSDSSGAEDAATFNTGVSGEIVYLNYQDLQRGLNTLFIDYVDDQGDKPFEYTRVVMDVSGQNIIATLKIDVRKIMGQLDYKAIFYDGTVIDPLNSIWRKKLFFMPEYDLADAPIDGSVTTITNTLQLFDNQISIDRGVNDTFYILPYANISGINPATRDYDIKITIPNGVYSRNSLYNKLNALFAANALCPNTRVSSYLQNGKEYTLFSVSVNKSFSTKDYKVTFYDTLGFSTCLSRGSTKSIQNVTWDTTVGWLLGFRSQPEYFLDEFIGIEDTVPPTDLTPKLNYYNSENKNACVLRGDTGVSVNLYNYFLIVLDDYTQNHINDGLVTTTMPITSVDVPLDVTYACNPITGKPIMSLVPSGGKGMTALQVYSNQQKILSQMAVAKSYSTGPYAKDVFALIPMKLTGLSPGQVYVETSGTLQNQDRVYFGPVNLSRMSIKLLSDRGDLVDLNNTNWSFSIIAEMLYKQ